MKTNSNLEEREISSDIFNVEIDSSFFEEYDIPVLPEGYGYKGGVARAALFWLKGFNIPIRDFDLIAIDGVADNELADSLSSRHMPRDYAYGDGVEFIGGLDEYFSLRDFTINEVALFGGRLFYTQRALESLNSRQLSGSDYELDAFFGRLGPKLSLKALLLKVIFEECTSQDWDVNDIEDTYFTDFYIALVLNKALSMGERIAKKLLKELQKRSIVDRGEDLKSIISRLDDIFSFDYSEWPDKISGNDYFDIDCTTYELQEIWLDNKYYGSSSNHML